MATPRSNTYAVASGAGVHAGRPPNVPAWVPAAGDAASIGYASGAHPSSLPATLADIDPQFQAWNPNSPDGYPGPWAGTGATRYTWQNIIAYCGGTWVDSLRKWVEIGAGHVAPNVPVPFAYDVPRLCWQWLGVPPPTDGLSGVAQDNNSAANVGAAYPSTQFDTAWAEWQGGYSGWPTGFARPGEVFPETGHSYQNIVWIPGSAAGNTNGHILNVSDPTGRHGGTDMLTGHVWNLDTGKWERTANKRAAGGASAGGACFDPTTGKGFAMLHASSTAKSQLNVYTPGTKTWSTTTATAAIDLPIEHGGLRAHPPSGLLLQFCPETAGGGASFAGVRHRIYAVDAAAAAAGSHTWQVLTVSASSWPLRIDDAITTIGWAYCPRNGCFYAINGRDGSTTLWKLAPPAGASSQAQHLSGTWQVTTETLSTGIVSKAPNGASTGASFIYNRLVWDELAGCLLYFPPHVGGRPQAIHPVGV